MTDTMSIVQWSKKETFRPRNRQNIFFLLMWSKSFLHHCIKLLTFYHLRDFLDLFWGRKFLFLTTVLLGLCKICGSWRNLKYIGHTAVSVMPLIIANWKRPSFLQWFLQSSHCLAALSINRALPIFNFYGYFRIFYGCIDFFFILKMDLHRFLGTQLSIKNPFKSVKIF